MVHAGKLTASHSCTLTQQHGARPGPHAGSALHARPVPLSVRDGRPPPRQKRDSGDCFPCTSGSPTPRGSHCCCGRRKSPLATESHSLAPGMRPRRAVRRSSSSGSSPCGAPRAMPASAPPRIGTRSGVGVNIPTTLCLQVLRQQRTSRRYSSHVAGWLCRGALRAAAWTARLLRGCARAASRSRRATRRARL